MSAPGVEGVVVCDSQGLCLSAHGTLKSETAALSAQLMALATKLEPGNTRTPVISLITDGKDKLVTSLGHHALRKERAFQETLFLAATFNRLRFYGVYSPMASEVALNLEFSGGSEFLVGDQKIHKVTVPAITTPFLLSDLLEWIKIEMLKDCDRPELLLDGKTVRPGVLVLVNECDWELLDKESTELKAGDTITFISTLHGG